MAPNKHDDPESAQELPGTEFYPFSGAYRSAPDDTAPDDTVPDDTVPDVPAMEQLPDPGALPDPGYPVMSAPAQQQASGTAVAAPSAWPADGPSAPSWPRPPVPTSERGPRQPASPPPVPTFTPASTVQPDKLPAAAKQVWSPDPYAAPRVPDEAPPLHGPSVPWSQVRAAADYQALGEPLAAPPSLDERAANAAGPVEALPRETGPRETGPREAAPRPTSAVLTSDLLLPGKRATPDDGWRRTLYRASGGLVHIGESSHRLRRRDLVSRVRAPVAGGHHRVAVLSLKGGVGKTTATIGIGATLASLRGDRVIAVDGNPDRGTLSDKVRLETPATIRDLLNERAMVARYADVRGFTSQSSSRLEILASDRDPGISVAFSADDYRAVAKVLERYYSICITDCGTGLLHSAMTGILELADQVVLVSSPSVDGARSASATLDWLEAHHYGGLVRHGVVVLSGVRRKSKSTVDLDRLEQHFAARCRAVVRVPYDPHLEEGAEFELDFLNAETADAYLTLAALVADGFTDPGAASASL